MKNILFLTFFISLSVFAQSNFESGYIINNNNTRTVCSINNLDWYNNPNEIKYKTTANEAPKTIKISDFKEFKIENYPKYKRFNVKIDRSTSDINQLSTTKDPIFIEETLFLKVIVEGDTNLYEYRDGNLLRFFFSKGNHETAEQLIYKEYLPQESNGAAENNFYKQQLLNNLDFKKVSVKEIKKVKYNKTDLQIIVLKSNATEVSSSIPELNERDKTILNVRAIAGVQFAKLSMDNNSSASYTFSTKPILAIGFEIESVFPFNKRKWSIFASPNFQSYKVTQKNNSNLTMTADYSFIEFPAGIRHYVDVNNKSKLFFDAGITLSLKLNDALKYSGQDLEVSNATNIFMGAGYKYGDFNIELRYNFNRELLPTYLQWKAKYASVGILLGYKFM
ncbi:hypothetical protein [Flavobacterium sp. TSSA_36]|uniref:hypothetical protein n=1 Tax=Flavobacterium sp. TSSA_36 TaxID=3447669 RepID=UPI003F31C7CA